MSIVQQSIPSSPVELRKFVPRAGYIKNSSTINRMLVTIDTSTAGLLNSDKFGSKAYKFSYDRSQSAIVSLNEAFFHIAGSLKFTNISANSHVIDSSKLAFSPQWLLSIINKLELNIGGTSYKSKQTPILYSHLKTLLSQDFNDLKNHVKDENLLQSFNDAIVGYPGTLNTSIATGKTIGLKLAANTSTASVVADAGATDLPGHIVANTILTSTIEATSSPDLLTTTIGGNLTYYQTYCEPDYSVIIPKFNINVKTGKSIIVPFACKLYLRDLFELPEIPLYNLPVEVNLLFTSTDAQPSINICGGGEYNGAGVLTEYWKIRVENFTQFNFNIVSLQLDNAMRSMIAKVYEKKQTVLVNDLNVEIVSLSGAGNGKSFNTKIPYEMGFESDFIGIAFPKTVQNLTDGYHRPHIPETTSFDYTTNDKYTISRSVNHTDPFAFKYIPIDSIELIADGVQLWSRNYINNKQDFEEIPANDAEAGYKYNPCVFEEMMIDKTPAADGTVGNKYSFIDQQYEYNVMKSCRFFMNQLDNNACTYNDFICKYYCILIPTKHFTQLSSNSQIQLKINFHQCPPTLDHFKLTSTNSITDMIFFNYNRRALVIENGIASIKDVRQSFSNEIDIPEQQSAIQMQTN